MKSSQNTSWGLVGLFPDANGMLDDDEEIDDEEEDNSDENKEGPDDDEEDEEDDLNSDDDTATDIIMTPTNVNTYEMTTIQREMFVDEIQEACQPVQARKQFFEMCRLNSPSIVFIKPEGIL